MEEPDVLVIILQKQAQLLLSVRLPIQLRIFVLERIRVKRIHLQTQFHSPKGICSAALPKVSVFLLQLSCIPRCTPSGQPAFYDLITRLQFEAKLTGVQQVANVQNLATLVANYTKAVCQRPFK